MSVGMKAASLQTALIIHAVAAPLSFTVISLFTGLIHVENR
jgi:hypothetical protein